jgi:hypothetical protein
MKISEKDGCASLVVHIVAEVLTLCFDDTRLSALRDPRLNPTANARESGPAESETVLIIAMLD